MNRHNARGGMWLPHLHEERGVGGLDREVNKPATKEHPAYQVRKCKHVVVESE